MAFLTMRKMKRIRTMGYTGSGPRKKARPQLTVGEKIVRLKTAEANIQKAIKKYQTQK